MKLSDKAIIELREVVRNHIGDAVNQLSERELQQFGSFVMSVMANSLKIHARLQE